ncbi:MAG: hypothetical protein FJY74_05580 [Candidatus Eisenbacteria bacterium]|nr:hypothetical protein [Candidatus Eisenbacteria bacterium]
MTTLRARIALVLLVLAASPIVAFAAEQAEQESLWDWIVRFLVWAAGGWHGY